MAKSEGWPLNLELWSRWKWRWFPPETDVMARSKTLKRSYRIQISCAQYNLCIHRHTYTVSISLSLALLVVPQKGTREDPRWMLGGENAVFFSDLWTKRRNDLLTFTEWSLSQLFVPWSAPALNPEMEQKEATPYYTSCTSCGRSVSPYYSNEDRERLARLRQEKRDYAREFSQNSTWVRQQTEMGVWSSG